MNSSLIKQLNQLQQSINEIQTNLKMMNTQIICNDDIKCNNTLTTNNLTVNNLSQLLGNVNIFGDLHLDNKIYLNNTCYLFIEDNKLCFNNGEKDHIVNLTEMY
jgi:hypothetical protein